MPRLFTALSVPEDVRTRLSLLQGGLPGARWIEPDNFHLTLSFIGRVDGRAADDVADVLDQIAGEMLELRITSLGCFGSSKPRAVFAYVEQSKDLKNLQASIERALRRVGITSDRRAFVPHITLARLKNIPPQAVAKWLGQCGHVASRRFEVDSFGLYSSKGSRGGGPYRLEDTYRFIEDGGEDAWWNSEVEEYHDHAAG
ncbi:MAG: RNA 2',3'-cyclic phosphodiesterase [Pseudomonadota bacterium]